MQAIILAAGLGTRLRPLTETMPKALIPVGGKPLIYHSLSLLKKNGIQDVVINLHYLGDMIEKDLGDGSRFGLRLRYSWEEKILGTGGGIRQAATFFPGKPVFVLNSDILIDVDLKALREFHETKNAVATMVVRPLDLSALDAPTAISLSPEGRILSIGQTRDIEGARRVHFTGVQILEPRFLKNLPEGESCIIQNGYQTALVKNEEIGGFLYEGYWNDLGTYRNYTQAEEDLKADLFSSPTQ